MPRALPFVREVTNRVWVLRIDGATQGIGRSQDPSMGLRVRTPSGPRGKAAMALIAAGTCRPLSRCLCTVGLTRTEAGEPRGADAVTELVVADREARVPHGNRPVVASHGAGGVDARAVGSSSCRRQDRAPAVPGDAVGGGGKRDARRAPDVARVEQLREVKMKRLVGLLVAVAVLVSSAPAFAASDGDPDDVDGPLDMNGSAHGSSHTTGSGSRSPSTMISAPRPSHCGMGSETA